MLNRCSIYILIYGVRHRQNTKNDPVLLNGSRDCVTIHQTPLSLLCSYRVNQCHGQQKTTSRQDDVVNLSEQNELANNAERRHWPWTSGQPQGIHAK